MELGLKVLETSLSFVRELGKLIFELLEVDRGRRLILDLERFPACLKSSSISPVRELDVGGFLGSFVDNVSRGGAIGKRLLQSSERSGAEHLDLVLLVLVRSCWSSPTIQLSRRRCLVFFRVVVQGIYRCLQVRRRCGDPSRCLRNP